MLAKWNRMPDTMRIPEVKEYYEALKKKRMGLVWKRCFDLTVSLLLILCLSPVMLGIALWIKLDSKGPVLFRQIRVTTGGKEFRIYKFRTMVTEAEKLGSQVTVKEDARITRAGHFLRKYRLDELPQLFNVLTGDMSFVGTRPEVPRYVKQYTPEMWATLLLPAGITSEASIKYKDEDALLAGAADVDRVYVEQVLPEKMRYNLNYLREFRFWRDIRIMLDTVLAVFQ